MSGRLGGKPKIANLLRSRDHFVRILDFSDLRNLVNDVPNRTVLESESNGTKVNNFKFELKSDSQTYMVLFVIDHKFLFVFLSRPKKRAIFLV